MAAPRESICFSEAYELRRGGQIQLEEYLKHIIAHYAGVRHDTDAEGSRPWLYVGFEYEVREITLNKDSQTLDESGKSQ
jgi:hypothetical protein